VAILPILNGIVPSTHVKPASKQHQDTHHKHVIDASMMMGFVAILISKESTMETSRENVEKHVTGSCFLFKKFSMPHFLIYLLLLASIMSSVAFSKMFEFLPQHSTVKSSITPSFDNFYPPPILTKHHTWYLHDANLFISIRNTLYGIHQRQLEESILFREVLQYGRNHLIRTLPIHPIPFDNLKKEIFDHFLVLLYCRTTTLNHLTKNDLVNIKRLCIDWYLPHQTAMII
jgi:hypothetical protein